MISRNLDGDSFSPVEFDDVHTVEDLYRQLDTIRMEAETSANALSSIDRNLHAIGFLLLAIFLEVAFGITDLIRAGWQSAGL